MLTSSVVFSATLQSRHLPRVGKAIVWNIAFFRKGNNAKVHLLYLMQRCTCGTCGSGAMWWECITHPSTFRYVTKLTPSLLNEGRLQCGIMSHAQALPVHEGILR
jgi:hypothetical protein